MAANGRRVVIVKDPSIFPEGRRHDQVVDALANTHTLVVLMSHGNKYRFPKGWTLPNNASLLEYDLELGSIEECVIRLRELLRAHGIDVHSRHLENMDPMPIPLAGSVLVMNFGTEVAFINNEEQLATKLSNKDNEIHPSEWDVL